MMEWRWDGRSEWPWGQSISQVMSAAPLTKFDVRERLLRVKKKKKKK